MEQWRVISPKHPTSAAAASRLIGRDSITRSDKESFETNCITEHCQRQGHDFCSEKFTSHRSVKFGHGHMQSNDVTTDNKALLSKHPALIAMTNGQWKSPFAGSRCANRVHD